VKCIDRLEGKFYRTLFSSYKPFRNITAWKRWESCNKININEIGTVQTAIFLGFSVLTFNTEQYHHFPLHLLSNTITFSWRLNSSHYSDLYLWFHAVLDNQSCINKTQWMSKIKYSETHIFLTTWKHSFISVFNQLDAQNLFHSKFYFMPLHVSSTWNKTYCETNFVHQVG